MAIAADRQLNCDHYPSNGFRGSPGSGARKMMPAAIFLVRPL